MPLGTKYPPPKVQLALAWVLAKGEDVIPISPAPREIEELERAVPYTEVVGERYAAATMRTVQG